MREKYAAAAREAAKGDFRQARALESQSAATDPDFYAAARPTEPEYLARHCTTRLTPSRFPRPR